MPVDPRLAELLLRWEEGRLRGETLTPEHLCTDCPELLLALQKRVQALLAIDFMLGPAEDENAPCTPTVPGGDDAGSFPEGTLLTRSRYRVVRFHARGGLGEVLVAHDEDLHRDVALKLVRRTTVADQDRCRRFLREAELTSRLEHPGIVPVYGLGHGEDGRPYYAMRFIRGETLGEAINRFHAADTAARDPGERSLALRQLLGRFVSACNAVAYAHGQGIIHRDLKPSNILLGSYGESLVVDWGLAKALRTAEDDSEPSRLPPSPIRDAQSMATEAGMALGTPAYMSPEQAAGQRNEVGPASDIYSLGATLYCLLTGRSPVPSGSAAKVLEQVRRGDFPPPRQVKKEVPPPLEAVCLMAMAPAPASRYATALALAADVEHWLADEPVSACPEPWSTKARRWVGRHRTLVTSSAAAALVVLVVLAAGAWLLNGAYAREKQAADDARHQRQLADDSFHQAQQAVHDLFTTVSQNKLLRSPGVQPVRRELLQLGLKYYHEFIQQRGDDPALQADVAVITMRIAQVTGDIGTTREALDWDARANDRFRALLRQEPSNPSHRRHLAEQLDIQAGHQLHSGDGEGAAASYNEAVELLTHLDEEEPNDEKTLYFLARASMNLAAAEGTVDRPRRAIAAVEKSMRVRTRLLQMKPENRLYRQDSAIALDLLANNQNDLGRWSEALRTRGQARAVLEQLLTEEQAHPGLRRDNVGGADTRQSLAINAYNVGIILTMMRKPTEAIAQYEEALAHWETLSRENPQLRIYRLYVPTTRNQLGDNRLELDQLHEALGEYRQARAAALKLLEEDSKLANLLCQVGMSLDGEAVVAAHRGQRDEADKLFAQALGYHQRALAAGPKVLENQELFCWHYCKLASAHRVWGQLPQAAAALEKAHEVRPAGPTTLLDVARGWCLCASAVGKDGTALTEPERAERDRYAAKAVEVLCQAVAAGFCEGELLRESKDFAPLRTRADFQEMLHRIGAPAS